MTTLRLSVSPCRSCNYAAPVVTDAHALVTLGPTGLAHVVWSGRDVWVHLSAPAAELARALRELADRITGAAP